MGKTTKKKASKSLAEQLDSPEGKKKTADANAAMAAALKGGKSKGKKPKTGGRASDNYCKACDIVFSDRALYLGHICAGHAEGASSSSSKKSNGAVVREPVARKQYKMDLPVKVSAEEAEKAGHLMAKDYREREALVEERRNAMIAFRKRFDAVDERLAAHCETFENQTKKIQVKVEERLTVETNEIEIVRLDTGEVVEKRTAKPDDRQEALFPEVAEPDPFGDEEAFS
jgi:hypothetical protein